MLAPVAAAIVVAAMAFSASPAPSKAGKTIVAGWETANVGYTAEPELAGYTDAAMALWSAPSGLRLFAGGTQVRVVFASLLPPITHDHQAAQANVTFYGEHISSCEVRVAAAAFFELNEFGRQNVITHEIGHCLGLDHSTVPGVMMNPRFYAFSSDDAGAIAGLYPPEQAAGAAAAAQQGPAQVAALSQAAGADSAMSAMPVAGGEPRPFGSTLPGGWSYIAWTGGAASPAACRCQAIARFDGTSWQIWTAGAGLPQDTLQVLRAGAQYWVYNP